MQLFYSGADQPGNPQINVDRSLGGYISSTPVPNCRIDNLFPLLSKEMVLQGTTDIRMIVLKNTTGVTANNIQIFTTVTGSHIKFQLAAVAPAINSYNQQQFESVMDGSSLPFQASISYQEGIVNAIVIPSMNNNDCIGIWVVREVDQTKFPELNAPSTILASDLYTLLTNATPVQDEVASLTINWS